MHALRGLYVTDINFDVKTKNSVPKIVAIVVIDLYLILVFLIN